MLTKIFVAGFRQLRLPSINLFVRPVTVAMFSLFTKSNTVLPAPTYNKKIYLNNGFGQFYFSTKIPICTYEEVEDLPNHPDKLLIDVREPAELKETGKIPTSINIPLAIVGQELAPNNQNNTFKEKYGRDKPQEKTEIIFHCRSGKRSGQAAEIASNMGYINVKNFEGSWLEWAEKQGLPK